MRTEPVNVWVSSALSPNRVDPDEYAIDDEIYCKSCTIAVPVINALLAVIPVVTTTVSKLAEFAENIVIR
jgi:hypothetical protein